MSLQIDRIQTKAKEYKADIEKLEQIVKKWEEEIHIKKISHLAEACYEAFNDLQMAISKIEDQSDRKKYELDCYKKTYNFLVFVENDVDPDLCVLLMNKSEAFSKLIKHYNLYCSKIEVKYDLELEVEKKLRDNQSHPNKPS